MPTIYLNRGFQQSSESISQQGTYTDTGLLTISESVVNGTPLTVLLPLDVSTITAMYISSDNTITVNPDGATSSFTVKANSPIVWDSNNPSASLFTADTTNAVITSTTSSATAVVEMRFLFTA